MAVELGAPPSFADLDRGDGAERVLRPIPRGRKQFARSALAGLTVLGVAAGLLVGVIDSGGTSQPSVQHDGPVSAMDRVAKPSNNSPTMVADPTESRFVVEANRLDAPYGCSMNLSGDGGRTWVGANPIPLPAGADSCYAPEVAFDRRGRLYLLFVGLHGAGHTPMGVFLLSSTDRARAFSSPRQILGPDNFQVRMALDPSGGLNGRIILAWLAAGASPPTGGFAPVPNPIMSAFSDDGGSTFSTPVQVSDPNRTYVDAPALAIGPDYHVHIVYYDLKSDVRDYEGLEGSTWDGTWALVSTTSVDGGAHFLPGIVVDQAIVPPGRVMLIYTMAPPSLAVDSHDDVYVSWYDDRNGDWDVFLRRSTDGGRHFGVLERLNDDLVGDGIDQYLPKLSVASDGRIDAIFYDRRSDPFNRFNDVYYTYSTDRGLHWSPNVKLTVWFSDPSLGPQYTVPSAEGLFDIGSRLALVSTPSKVLAAWTDTRDEQKGQGAQDIFGTEILFPSRPLWETVANLLALALVVIGVGGLAIALGATIRERRSHGSA